MTPGTELLALLPHRPPILLLDSAEMDNDHLRCHQRIPDRHHPVLAAHFPDFPVWPGVLLLEAMAQTTAVYLLQVRGRLQHDEIPVFGAADTRFLHPVFPRQLISYKTRLIRRLGDNALFSVKASHEGQVVARAQLSGGIQKHPTPSSTPR